MTFETSKTLPLSMLRPGEKGSLVTIRGHRNMRGPLARLDLKSGDAVQVISGNTDGQMIVGFKNSAHLAIGRSTAQQILVKITND